jgi:CheY-like chemotaxis protein
MAPEVMERIFDPFFTTKGPGKGSGMGLAVVHGTLKRCEGAITVSSEPGKGSTFNVFIPRIETVPSQRSVSSRTFAGGTERILIVEDEDVQLQSMVRTLEWLGYRVTAKTDGREALAEFQKNPQGFDLVITDQAMPVMTGAQLTEALLKIRPEIPIILCTGFSEAVSEERAKSIGVREFIRKPFSIVEMSETIRRVLSEPTGPHPEQ